MGITEFSLTEAAQRSWDVIVVGAGVAGSVAAHGLARRGLAVLLVDKARFPRWKVCGCCLNPAATAMLAEVGLGDVLEQCGAAAIQTMRLGVRRRQADIDLGGWKSLSRERLDAALVEAAVRSGAGFLPGTAATLDTATEERRTVKLRQDGQEQRITALLVLAADGLGGRLLGGEDGCEAMIAPGSRVGAGVIVTEGPAFYRPGVLHMAYGVGGYVGLSRLEDGRLNIGAALDVDLLRTAHSPGPLAARLLEEVGWPAIPDLADLTRQRALPAAERVLALGDAAGYLEPFTGEGISWAASSAAAIIPFAEQAVHHWQLRLVEEWAASQRQSAKRKQRLCRGITWLSRHASLARVVVGVLSLMPWLARPLVSQLRAAKR
jgi:flavin-dependent dehydrogenase